MGSHPANAQTKQWSLRECCDYAVPRGRNKIGYKRLSKVEHKRNNGHTKDTVDTNSNSDAFQMGFPTVLLLTALGHFIVGGLGIVL